MSEKLINVFEFENKTAGMGDIPMKIRFFENDCGIRMDIDLCTADEVNTDYGAPILKHKTSVECEMNLDNLYELKSVLEEAIERLEEMEEEMEDEPTDDDDDDDDDEEDMDDDDDDDEEDMDDTPPEVDVNELLSKPLSLTKVISHFMDGSQGGESKYLRKNLKRVCFQCRTFYKKFNNSFKCACKGSCPGKDMSGIEIRMLVRIAISIQKEKYNVK